MSWFESRVGGGWCRAGTSNPARSKRVHTRRRKENVCELDRFGALIVATCGWVVTARVPLKLASTVGVLGPTSGIMNDITTDFLKGFPPLERVNPRLVNFFE